MKASLTVVWTVVTVVLFTACSRSPEAARDKHLARGRQLLGNQDYSRAALEFRNAARFAPRDAEVHFQMGTAFIGAGDLLSAADAFRRASELDPRHTRAQVMVSELMTATGHQPLLHDAETRLNRVVAQGAAAPDVWNALGWAELKLGKTEDAVRSLEQAAAARPQALDSSVRLAVAKVAGKDIRGAEDVLQKACDAAPGSADARVVLGRFYNACNRFAEAEQEFRRALAINSSSAVAMVELAKTEIFHGRKAQAEGILKRLAAMSETRYSVLYAVFLFQEGRRQESVTEFERLAKEIPENRKVRSALVQGYRSVNRITDAAAILTEALRKNPKDVDALLQRAELSLAAVKYPAAEADLNQVLLLLPDLPEAHYRMAKLHQSRRSLLQYREGLAKVLSLDPTLLAVRLELAQSLVSGNNAQAALSLLNDAPAVQKASTQLLIQRNWALWATGDIPELRKGVDAVLARERVADALVQDGLCKLHAGNLGGCRASMKEALERNPADIRALTVLRDSYAAENKPGFGLQQIQEHAARHPQLAQVQNYLGTLLAASGDRERAYVAFTAAKAADPAHARSDLSLAELDALEGKWEDARTRLKTVLAAQSGDTAARLWLASAEHVHGNHTQAIAELQKVVEANPENSQALNNLAWLLMEHGGDADAALRYAERAVELAPDRGAVADTLGWILYRRGVYGSAVKHLQRAVAQKDSAVEWKYHLAMAYAKAGDGKRGSAMLAEARKISTAVPEAAMAQNVFRESPLTRD